MVSELKDAVSSNDCSHSSLLPSLSSSSSEGKGLNTPTLHPSFHLFVHFPLLCVLCNILATDTNMHDLGECFPPNGLDIASAIAMLTTSWYFSNFKSDFFQKIHSISLVLKTTTCTIVPPTDYRFCNPIPCPSLLPHAGILCFLTPTRDQRKCQHRPSSCTAQRTTFFFKYSSVAGFGICPFVNASLVKIHIHAANLDPTLFLHPPIHRSRPWSS